MTWGKILDCIRKTALWCISGRIGNIFTIVISFHQIRLWIQITPLYKCIYKVNSSLKLERTLPSVTTLRIFSDPAGIGIVYYNVFTVSPCQLFQRLFQNILIGRILILWKHANDTKNINHPGDPHNNAASNMAKCS